MSKKDKKELTADQKVEKLKAKSAKAMRTPSQIVFDLLMSKVNDPELQDRYNSMERNVKSWKETYNAYVLQYNDAIKRKTKISEILLESARLGLTNPEAIKLDKEVDEELTRIVLYIEDAKKCFENDERLMSKYRELTQNKLFHFWEVLNELEKDFAPFLTFKTEFDNKIF